MNFIKGSPCYCGSGKLIETCCIDFDSQVSHRDQVRTRQKYKFFSDDEEISLLATNIGKEFKLQDYDLTKFDEEKMSRCGEILSEKAELMTFSELFFNEYADLIKYSDKIENFGTNEMDNEINRLVINFVSNAKLFIDFLENKMKKNYMKFYSEWKKRQSYFFDETFEYSFLYHLRNHVQHVGMPIQTIKSKLVVIDDEEKKVTSFNLSKNNLLNDRSLHKKVRANLLEKIEIEEISIMPMVIKYHDMVEMLYLLSLEAFILNHEVELNEISKYFEDRNLTNKMFKAKILKGNYLKGNFEGLTMNPLVTKYNITKDVVELAKLGIINLEVT